MSALTTGVRRAALKVRKDDLYETPEVAIEAWELADRAEAISGAIKAWKLGADMVWEAAELALRAYRQTGVLLGEAEPGGDRKSRKAITSPRGDLISKDDRHRCRELARPPEERFEGYLADRRAKRTPSGGCR